MQHFTFVPCLFLYSKNQVKFIDGIPHLFHKMLFVLFACLRDFS